MKNIVYEQIAEGTLYTAIRFSHLGGGVRAYRLQSRVSVELVLCV